MPKDVVDGRVGGGGGLSQLVFMSPHPKRALFQTSSHPQLEQSVAKINKLRLAFYFVLILSFIRYAMYYTTQGATFVTIRKKEHTSASL